MQDPITAITLQITFKKADFLNIISAWNNIDRSIFLMHYLIDFIYPFVYGRLMYLLILDLSKKSQTTDQKLALADLTYIPALAAVSDLLENTLHLLMVGSYIEVEALPVAAAAFFSIIKWSNLFGCVLVLIIAYLRQGLKKAS